MSKAILIAGVRPAKREPTPFYSTRAFTLPRPEPKALTDRWAELASNARPSGRDEEDLVALAHEIDPDAWKIPQMGLRRFLALATAMRVTRHLGLHDPEPPAIVYVSRPAAAPPEPVRFAWLRGFLSRNTH